MERYSMKRLKIVQVILIGSMSIWACAPQTKKQEQQATQITQGDSLTIDLLAWQQAGRLQNSVPITVPDDPVFHQAKRYQAIPLILVLQQIKGFERLNPQQTQLVFECEDGYNPSLSLEKVLQKKAFLAVKDLDAPKGSDWIDAQKEGRTMKVAPFYVVYTDVPSSDYGYKWPYNLVRMRLTPVSSETAAIFPKEDDTVVKGYDLFKTNCLTCHAMNGIGGKMGPELNIPMSVTEYWQLPHLQAFILRPSTYRNDCKMPTLTHLKQTDVAEIVRYMQYMALHKLPNS